MWIFIISRVLLIYLRVCPMVWIWYGMKMWKWGGNRWKGIKNYFPENISCQPWYNVFVKYSRNVTGKTCTNKFLWNKQLETITIISVELIKRHVIVMWKIISLYTSNTCTRIAHFTLAYKQTIQWVSFVWFMTI